MTAPCKPTSIIKSISHGLMISIWIICPAILAYWEWFDNPVVYTTNEATVDNPLDIHPGGLLRFTKHTCVSREAVPNSAHRWITNKVVIDLPESSMQIGTGCDVTHRVIELPFFIELGPHKYHYKATFQINPIKQESVENTPFWFVVTPDPNNPTPNKGPPGDAGPVGKTGPRGPPGD